MSAISAKALNSTLGTENFKGLDQLLLEPRGLRPSDNILYLLKSKTFGQVVEANVSFQAGKPFKPRISGGVKFEIKGLMLAVNESRGVTVRFVNKKNASEFSISLMSDSTNSANASLYFNVEAGDEWQIYLTPAVNGRLSLEYIAVCADVINLPSIIY